MIECYETILCFPNFPLYKKKKKKKKKKKYEKFQGPLNPSLQLLYVLVLIYIEVSVKKK